MACIMRLSLIPCPLKRNQKFYRSGVGNVLKFADPVSHYLHPKLLGADVNEQAVVHDVIAVGVATFMQDIPYTVRTEDKQALPEGTN